MFRKDRVQIIHINNFWFIWFTLKIHSSQVIWSFYIINRLKFGLWFDCIPPNMWTPEVLRKRLKEQALVKTYKIHHTPAFILYNLIPIRHTPYLHQQIFLSILSCVRCRVGCLCRNVGMLDQKRDVQGMHTRRWFSTNKNKKISIIEYT